MLAGNVVSLNVPTSVAAGTTFEIVSPGSTNGCGIVISGTFVQTLSVEVSQDDSNWTVARNFNDAAMSGITSNRPVSISGTFRYVRINVTAHTSGQADVRALFQRF